MSEMLIFDVAELTCALPLNVVHELLPLPELSRPPGLPSLIEGFFNLRGQGMAVLRLDRLLGREGTTPTFYTPLILLHARGETFTVLVDRVRTITEIDTSALRLIAERNIFNGCVAAEFYALGVSVFLLTIERILLEEEQRHIAEYQTIASRRLALFTNNDSQEVMA